MNRKKIIEDILSQVHALGYKMKIKSDLPHGQTQVTHAQSFILCMISQDKSTSVKELSQKLSISPSAVTQLIDGLVSTGCVIRTEDAQDRRATQITLSAKGRRQLLIMKKKRLESWTKLFQVLSDAELITYQKLQHKLFIQFNNA